MLTLIQADYFDVVPLGSFGGFGNTNWSIIYSDRASITRTHAPNDYMTDKVGIFDESYHILGQNSLDHFEAYGTFYNVSPNDVGKPLPDGALMIAKEELGFDRPRYYYLQRVGNDWCYCTCSWDAWYGTYTLYGGAYIYSHHSDGTIYYKEIAKMNGDLIYIDGDPAKIDPLALFKESEPKRLLSRQIVRVKSNGRINSSLFRFTVPTFPVVNWGVMLSNCIDGIGFESNGVQYSADLRNMAESVTSTKSSLLKLVGKYPGSNIMKNVSQAYLQFHYGWKLFISDTKDLLDALSNPNFGTRQCNYSQTYEFEEYAVEDRILLNYSPFAQLRDDLDKLVAYADMDLSVKNAWDSVPYSFVVDWFVKVSDLLERVSSTYDFLNQHQIRYLIESQKMTKPFSASRIGFAGDGHVERYRRWPKTDLPTVGVNLQLSPGNPTTHWVDGTALYIAKA